MREARQAARQEDGQTPGNILPPPMASLDGIQRCGRALADEAYDRVDRGELGSPLRARVFEGHPRLFQCATNELLIAQEGAPALPLVEGGEAAVVAFRDELVKGCEIAEEGQDPVTGEPCGCLGLVVEVMAAPVVGEGISGQPGFDGVEVNVTHDLEEVGVRIDEQALIATAKQGTVPPVGAVEPLSIQSVEVAHDAGEITQGGLKEQVVMGGHAAVGEDLDLPAAVNVLEQVEEAVVIGVPKEDPPALQAAVHDMVVGTGELDAQRSSHSASLRAS